MKRIFRKSLKIPACLVVIQFSAVGYLAGEKKSSGEVKLKTGEYLVEVAAASSVAPGKEANLKITILPVSPWKMNDVSKDGKKFPFAVAVTPDEGVSFKKSKYKRADAAKVSKAKVVFIIPFTAKSAGRFDVKMAIDLSVCKAGSCHMYWGSTAAKIKVKITSKIPDEVIRVQKDKYVITAVFPSEVQSGKEAKLKLTILPVSPNSLNEKYPFKVQIPKNPNVSFSKKEYGKQDAKEISKEEVVFVLPFTAKTSGKIDVKIKVRLSVVASSGKKNKVETITLNVNSVS